jgi:hypothetical protein
MSVRRCGFDDVCLDSFAIFQACCNRGIRQKATVK